MRALPLESKYPHHAEHAYVSLATAVLAMSSLLWRPTQLYLKGRGEGGRGEGKQNWGTLSRGFGLRSFRPEILAWGVFVGRRFRPGPKSPIYPAENSAFSREGRGGDGKGRREGGGWEGKGLTGSLWPTQCRLETQVEGAEPGPKSPHFPERGGEGVGRGGGGEGGGGEGGGLTDSLWPTQCRLETQVEGAEHVNFFM